VALAVERPLRPPGRASRGLGELKCMSEEATPWRWLNRWVARASSPRGAAVVIASVSTTITVAAGLLMTVIDQKDFPSLGSGLWWAVQTVTTVGYGDHVPETTAGQIVAALVMLLGIGFITIITASITSTFVTRLNRQQGSAGDGAPSAEQLQRIDERLERIEAALRKRS
jgi:voltage-gated potassium channel